MHELSIAQEILYVVKSNPNVTKANDISKIHITLGVLSGVEKDALVYSFATMNKPPPFSNTRLVVSENTVVIFCESCQKHTEIHDCFTLKCEYCGALTSQIVKGKELTIDSIEY